MDFQRWRGSKEDEKSGIIRPDDDHGLLLCGGHYFRRLLGKRRNDNRDLLGIIIATFELSINQRETSTFAEEKVVLHQDNVRLHTCTISLVKIVKMEFLQYLACSPNSHFQRMHHYSNKWAFAEPSKSYFWTAYKFWKNLWKNVLSWNETVLKNKKLSQTTASYYLFLTTYWTTLVVCGIYYRLDIAFTYWSSWTKSTISCILHLGIAIIKPVLPNFLTKLRYAFILEAV